MSNLVSNVIRNDVERRGENPAEDDKED